MLLQLRRGGSGRKDAKAGCKAMLLSASCICISDCVTQPFNTLAKQRWILGIKPPDADGYALLAVCWSYRSVLQGRAFGWQCRQRRICKWFSSKFGSTDFPAMTLCTSLGLAVRMLVTVMRLCCCSGSSFYILGSAGIKLCTALSLRCAQIEHVLQEQTG